MSTHTGGNGISKFARTVHSGADTEHEAVSGGNRAVMFCLRGIGVINKLGG